MDSNVFQILFVFFFFLIDQIKMVLVGFHIIIIIVQYN